jgi:hypothetical protein
MTNTLVGANLRGISDGARLEQLTADLLRREGYDVDPTGVRGPDAGRDALLEHNGEQGILHCSAQSDGIEEKIGGDAEKAADRSEDFDFFIFSTTSEMAGTKRDRLETDIATEYGWQVRVLDFERLRNRLVGDPENHDLAREHLNVDPGTVLESVGAEVAELYEDLLSRLRKRKLPYGQLSESVSNLPLVAVHVLPAEATSTSNDRIARDLPDPPAFIRERSTTESFGDLVITSMARELTRGEFSEYVCLHADGWVEAVTTRLAVDRDGEEKKFIHTIDEKVVDLVERVLIAYEEAGIVPPFYVYITVLGGGEYIIRKPDRIVGPASLRPLGDDEVRLNRVRLKGYEADVPFELRRSLGQLWDRIGWLTGSVHYTERDDGEGYEWNPYSER